MNRPNPRVCIKQTGRADIEVVWQADRTILEGDTVTVTIPIFLDGPKDLGPELPRVVTVRVGL